ncbi:MAG: prepilin peptidase [Planctomycetes bacterium]|nr:prepilin peptidase [Planctomycetota bacterium]
MSVLLEESPALLSAFAAVFGLLVGSFLNVVIYRLPREGKGVAEGRSHCPSCGHAIAWYENVPVLSWLALRGKCRACRGAISVRYPTVELATGALFWFVFEHLRVRHEALDFPWALLFVLWALLAVLLAASMIDFDFQILPDVLTKPMMPLGVLCSALVPALHREHSLIARWKGGDYTWLHGALDGVLGMLAGLALVGGLRWLASKLAGREAMGFGDVKLMGGLGAFVGAVGVVFVLLVGAMLGSVMGLLNVLRILAVRAVRMSRRRAQRPRWRWDIAWIAGRVIPFGPALSLGGAVVLLFRSELNVFLFQTWPAWVQGR